MEPTRQTVMREHVAAARGSLATLNSEELSKKRNFSEAVSKLTLIREIGP
jgi:hypothetical protein